MSDPNDLMAFLEEAWQHLMRGVADARAPARFPTLATVSPGGKPEQRTVALRAARPSDATLDVHTDIATPKVTALQQNPWAALHVWVPRADLQIRMTGKIDIITGPAIDPDWDRVPVASRVSYGTVPTPGTPIDHVHAYEKPADRTRFALLRCHVEEIDLVHLGQPHRRAIYKGTEGVFAGTWVAP